MESFLQIIKTDTFLIFSFCINIVLLIGFFLNLIYTTKLNKRYRNFMKKLGNGKNIEEDLENYMYQVNKVKENNAEISKQIEEINEDLEKCIQKVGIVRYNAYKDTGSDLSFALALLNKKDDGVVLNGIYSREMSNIYAKPVNKGNSSYTLSEEEKNAIEKSNSKGNK